MQIIMLVVGGGGLEIPQDTGESKFIGIQMRFEKFLLLGEFALFCSSQASLLLNSPEKKVSDGDKERAKLFPVHCLKG